MKQPHEDVRGSDHTDSDLLSLDESAVAHREAIARIAKHLFTATSVGSPAPIVERISQRMRNPQIGDFVVEWIVGLSPRRDLDSRIKAMGYLVERRTEWWTTDEEWERYKAEETEGMRKYDPGYEFDEDRSTDEAWYVQYGPEPADICRWTNCAFIALPIGAENFSLPPDSLPDVPSGPVLVTRDNLLGALADSGFQFGGAL